MNSLSELERFKIEKESKREKEMMVEGKKSKGFPGSDLPKNFSSRLIVGQNWPARHFPTQPHFVPVIGWSLVDAIAAFGLFVLPESRDVHLVLSNGHGNAQFSHIGRGAWAH